MGTDAISPLRQRMIEDISARQLRAATQKSHISECTGTCRRSRCCKSTAEERGAGNPHATFCGNRGRVTASGDPVLGVKFPGPTRQKLPFSA